MVKVGRFFAGFWPIKLRSDDHIAVIYPYVVCFYFSLVAVYEI